MKKTTKLYIGIAGRAFLASWFSVAIYMLISGMLEVIPEPESITDDVKMLWSAACLGVLASIAWLVEQVSKMSSNIYELLKNKREAIENVQS